jgi:hypothetical protein
VRTPTPLPLSRVLNATKTCTVIDAQNFLMKIFNNLYELDAFPIIKNVVLIGGWNNIGYMQLRNQINTIHEDYEGTLSDNSFHQFVRSIKLNLIGFNMPSKETNGKNKEPNDDDDPNDYIVDCTIVYDRSSTSSTFTI